MQLERARSLAICNQTDIEQADNLCPPSKYRQANGECNNVSHRKWGARGDIFLRLLASDYADDVSQPRTSRGTHALPDADFIIDQLQRHIDAELRHPHITAMLPAWGQLLSNDLYEYSQLPLQGSGKCCLPKRASQRNPFDLEQCYVRQGEECKEYRRTAPAYDAESCHQRRREQMNVASAYIDGSGLYGTTLNEFQQLRTYLNGGVRTDACRYCQNLGATAALHRALLQHHNNIGEVLASLNPNWSDEDLFLEAKRIVTAQIQHITYNEFLPLVLGQEATANPGLR